MLLNFNCAFPRLYILGTMLQFQISTYVGKKYTPIRTYTYSIFYVSTPDNMQSLQINKNDLNNILIYREYLYNYRY